MIKVKAMASEYTYETAALHISGIERNLRSLLGESCKMVETQFDAVKDSFAKAQNLDSILKALDNTIEAIDKVLQTPGKILDREVVVPNLRELAKIGQKLSATLSQPGDTRSPELGEYGI